MANRLANKVVLVFGAGSSGPGWGNGKAAAVLYAREGAAVVAVDIARGAAEETVEIIRSEGGTGAATTADITSEIDVEAAVAFALERFGRIDILHNNVGMTEMAELDQVSLDSWHRGIDLNLTGAFLACRAVVPRMKAAGGGAIVNVSSLASMQVNNYPYYPYLTAKAGLNHFTRAIAVRHAPDGIRANAVLPGVIDTPLVRNQIAGRFKDEAEMLKARNAASPMGRMGTAWDVAHAALFLASDEAGYITGVCLPVDGGKSCAGR
ncbi:MAG: SDR family oxidoreductase [Rhizobiales bacterium]|nr:SDR family oxidoreductase [Hyphomicrobiales bacterium]